MDVDQYFMHAIIASTRRTASDARVAVGISMVHRRLARELELCSQIVQCRRLVHAQCVHVD